jgi:hypothetical protein
MVAPTVSTFVLVHSPLVGPTTWSLVADELGARGVTVALPTLPEDQRARFWRLHAEAVAGQVVAAGRPRVLVGQRGLPVTAGHRGCHRRHGLSVRARRWRPAARPRERRQPDRPAASCSAGAGRRARGPALRGQKLSHLGDEDLLEEIPDQRLRAKVVAEVRPQPRQFWTEALPAIPGWPDAPCGYLELSPHYAATSAGAREQGWRYRHLRGGHFEMLVRPTDVADAILELAGERRAER